MGGDHRGGIVLALADGDAGFVGLYTRLVAMRLRETALTFDPVPGHAELVALKAEIAAVSNRLRDMEPSWPGSRCACVHTGTPASWW